MKLFEKGELRILWPFYLDSLLSPMLFFMPAFIIVYFSGIGLSAAQMGVLLMVWPLASLIFEIPTGAIADIYGRKISVLIGYFLEGLAMLSLFFWKEYYLMLISFAFLGFAGTLSSGSKEAWIADLVKKEDKKLLHKYFSKAMILDSFALIVSGFLGAFLVKYFGISVIWVVAFLSFIVSLLILLFAREYFISRKIKIKRSITELVTQTKKSIHYSYSHHVLFYFIFAGFISAFALTFQTNLSWIPLLKGLGMQDYQFGYLWSIMAAVMMVSPLFAMKFFKKGKERRFIIFGLVAGIIATLLILLAYNLVFAVVLMLLAMFFFFAKRPTERTYFHKFIPNKLRATIGSVESMVLSIASIVSLPLAGYLIDWVGPRYTIFISGIIIIPAVILYLKIKEKK